MKTIFIIPVAIILFSLSSCSSSIQRKLYSSNQPNNPSLEKKNDYSISATYGEPNGFDLNAGYAITNRFAIIGGLHTQQNRDIEQRFSWFSPIRDSSALSYHHKGYHLGAGAYFPLQKNNPKFFFSFFGGYTNGTFKMTETLYHLDPPDPPQNNFYQSNITRWFAQGSFSFYDKIFHQSLLARFNYVGYSDVKTDYTEFEQQNYLLPPFGYSKWSQFFDLAFDTKIFFTKDKRLGCQIYGVITPRINRKHFNFSHYPFRGGIGLIFKSPFQNREPKK